MSLNGRFTEMTVRVGCIARTERYCKSCHESVLEERRRQREWLESRCSNCFGPLDTPRKLTRQERRQQANGMQIGFYCEECRHAQSSEGQEFGGDLWG